MNAQIKAKLLADLRRHLDIFTTLRPVVHLSSRVHRAKRTWPADLDNRVSSTAAVLQLFAQGSLTWCDRWVCRAVGPQDVVGVHGFDLAALAYQIARPDLQQSINRPVFPAARPGLREACLSEPPTAVSGFVPALWQAWQNSLIEPEFGPLKPGGRRFWDLTDLGVIAVAYAEDGE